MDIKYEKPIPAWESGVALKVATRLIKPGLNTLAHGNKDVGKVKQRWSTETRTTKLQTVLLIRIPSPRIRVPTFKIYKGDTGVGDRTDHTKCTDWSQADVSHRHSGEAHGLNIRENPPRPTKTMRKTLYCPQRHHCSSAGTKTRWEY